LTIINREVIVSISLDGEDIRVGSLWFHLRSGRERASFEYDKKWLNHPEKFALDPALNLTEGSFNTKEGLSIFGAIGDSAPDRWGRILMRRAEIARAKVQNTTPSTLFEIDYLLGVNDETRQGALRFSMSPAEDIFWRLSKKQAFRLLLIYQNYY
jgi:serine/threonine-protein kinase HipA